VDVRLSLPAAYGACQVLRAGMEDFLEQDRARLVPRLPRELSPGRERVTSAGAPSAKGSSIPGAARSTASGAPDSIDISDQGRELAASAVCEPEASVD
jgi:hypothetical protein